MFVKTVVSHQCHEIKGRGMGAGKGGFHHTLVQLCVSLSLSGAACQLGNGGM